MLDDGQFVLRNLVALRQIGVKVVFARKDGTRRDRGVDSQPEHRRHADDFLIQDGQYTRVTEVNQARLGVRLSAELGTGPGKNFAAGCQLGMNLQANNNVPLHRYSPSPLLACGAAVCQSVSF